MTWARYRNLRGSLHIGMRIEASMSIMASMYANAHSKMGGYRPVDFMPHADEQPVSLDQAMKEWT